MPSAAMMICALSILCLSFASCEQGPLEPVRWTHYSSKEAGFEIDMPVDAISSTAADFEYAFGKRNINELYWRRDESDPGRLGLRSVHVRSYDIPDLTRRYSQAFILDSFVQAHMNLYDVQHAGRLIEYTAFRTENNPARRIRSMIDYGKSDSLYVHEEYILAGDRMFQLNARGYKRRLDTPSMRKFFSSFRLLR